MTDNRGSGGAKKHGRNMTKCMRYRAVRRREKNKARKAGKHKRHMEAAAKRRARHE